MTTTHTRTITLTEEEKAVLAAVEVKKGGHTGKWTMHDIRKTVHDNAKSTAEAHAAGRNDEPTVDVINGDIPVIVGQLIERGLIVRSGRVTIDKNINLDAQVYSRA